MRLEIARNFLTPEECAALNEWANQGIACGWLDTGVSREQNTQKRLTSRMYGDRFETPEIAQRVSKKTRAHAGVANHPLIEGHGRDGVVVSCTFDGGDTYEHQDPRAANGLATLRCNVMTQKPESGGVLYLEGKPVLLEVGDLHCYLASEHLHYVDQTFGGIPRILWMFGAHVLADDWNSGEIKFGLP